MAAELQGDIDAASEDGVDAMTLVGGDPESFARAWASARGVVRPRWRLVSTVVASLLGMLPGTAMLVIVPLAMTSSWFVSMVDPSNADSGYWYIPFPLLVLAYLVSLVVIYAGALLAVSTWLRRQADPARSRTVKLLAVCLPVVLLLDGVVSRTFDNAFGSTAYVDGHWRPTHMWPLLFLAILVVGLAAIRWWAVHSVRGSAPKAAVAEAAVRGQR